MDYDINRNGSGYYDPTAFQGLKNYIKSEEKSMELYSGDIFKGRLNNGGEREFVILSVHDRYSTVLMLSDNDKLPFAIKCEGMKYTDPGQLQYMFNDNLIDFIRSMKQPEFDDLMNAVIDYLGYEAPVKEVVKEVTVPAEKEAEETGDSSEIAAKMAIELAKASAERDVFKELYENLLQSMISK